MSLPPLVPQPFVPPGRQPVPVQSNDAWMSEYMRRRRGQSQNEGLTGQARRMEDAAGLQSQIKAVESGRGVIERAAARSRRSSRRTLSRGASSSSLAGCRDCSDLGVTLAEREYVHAEIRRMKAADGYGEISR